MNDQKHFRVFDLRLANDDEAEGIRDLLDETGIYYYETERSWYRPSNAIWVTNEGDFQRARELIDAFEKDYALKARESFSPELRRLRMRGHFGTRLFDAISGIFSNYAQQILILIGVLVALIIGFLLSS